MTPDDLRRTVAAAYSNPTAGRKAIERAWCERSLYEYVQYAWPVLEPGRKFVPGKILEAICEHLEAVVTGELKRLAILVPPGSMKSMASSVFMPSWLWGPLHRPDKRIISVSHAQKLAIRDSLRMRRLITSEWYQEHWPHVQLTSDQKEKIKYENTAMGFREAATASGITGSRGDIVICDDLLSVDDAASDAIREGVEEWFREALPTRMNDPEESAIVLIMQRLHERDPAGVAKELGYDTLCYDKETEILTARGWTKFGDLNEGEAVMGVDPNTLCGSWEVPTNYVKKKFKGEMIHFSSNTVDLCVTPEHRMVYKDCNDFIAQNKELNWRVKMAKDLPRDFYIPQAIKWTGSRKPMVIGGHEIDPLLYAEFMGWYLSEGCSSVERCSTVIYQNEGALSDEIELMASKMPFNFSKYKIKGRKVIRYVIWSKALAEHLKCFGKSHHKYAPDEIKNMDAECLEKFVISYAKGDGTAAGREGNNISIVSRSQKMIDDLQECCVKLGWASSSRAIEINPKPFNGYVMPGGIMWKLTIRYSKCASYDRKWYATVRGRHNKKMEYDDFVYCVSVPSTALVVRRNGIVSISGNCIPMEYEPSRHCKTSIGWEDWRSEEGELAWPERFPRAVVDNLKKSMTPYSVAAQLQQSPEIRGGNIFKRNWWQYWVPVVTDRTGKDEVEYPNCTYIIAAVDTAYTKEEENDPSAMVVMGSFGDHLIVLYAWEERLEFNDLLRKVARTCRQFGVSKLLVENKASGISIAQEMKRVFKGRDFGIDMFNPGSRDKRARANSVAHMLYHGEVFVRCEPDPDENGEPVPKPHAVKLIDRAAKFPRDAHDDIVDAFVMCLAHMRKTGIATLQGERDAEERDLLRIEKPAKPLYPGSK